ncbi:helix-turn-helix domain-containing protein [Xenorhabdus japonica]|uniref:SOS-response transcriptional repressor LexA (RecA-mediated autopeptidase) n=1 Tax=Xenorhabdus japonica TaxID=53341 RepID=A0A1I5EI65_9GAMM|nr:S24 family peptidase [Xenorhabdus japonica]SFO10791.1 SOS-response transcriptional repressor LexA (RecA-mediated autopeptidase) [Xenorhabdus japonica]
MSLAGRVKNRRLELKLTQVEAAMIAGISQQSWATIEDGKTLRPRNIISIAKALKCNAEWLMTGGDFQPLCDVNIRRVPLISYVQAEKIARGFPIRGYNDLEHIITDMNWSGRAFALRIDGDSMEPDFKAGDIVIIDPEVTPNPGEFVVAASYEREATFKKYRPIAINIDGTQHFELIPLNNDYPILDNQRIKITIMGTMVEHRIYRRKR